MENVVIKGVLKLVLQTFVCLVTVTSSSMAVAQDLILSCKGEETTMYLHYDKQGNLTDQRDEKTPKSLTLQIKNSRWSGRLCKFSDSEIFCNKCNEAKDYMACINNLRNSFNSLEINRFSGQATMDTLAEVSNLRMVMKFEGVCTLLENRRF